MNESLLRQENWRIIDQSSHGAYFQAMQSFAIDDTLCSSVGKKESDATARTWVHHNTVVLGIQDTKLPFLQQGIEYLESAGYKVIVRNSGGLAVVLDEGVLNISLIFPDTEKGIDINRGYDAMVELVNTMLQNYQVKIEAREIVGSYCPGSYDLSVDGRKFAGISQRRLRGGVAVQIYLCATESGSERAEVIQEFYRHALQGQSSKYTFPIIVPNTMASLSELTNKEINVQTLVLHLFQTLKKNSNHIYSSQLTNSELGEYEKNYLRMIDRNKKALET